MQNKVAAIDVRVLIEMIDAIGVEQTAAPLDAVHDVVFLEQKLGEVGAVLAGDSGNECDFLHGDGSVR